MVALETTPTTIWAKRFVAEMWKADFEATRFAQRLFEDVRTNAFNGTYLSDLIAELLRAATLSSSSDPRAFRCIVFLMHNEHFSWADFLNAVTDFKKFDKPRCLQALLLCLQKLDGEIKCDSRKPIECQRLADATINVFIWISNGIEKCAADPDLCDSLELLVNAFLFCKDDGFVENILQLQEGNTDILSSIVQPICRATELINNGKLQYLGQEVKSIFKLKPYEPMDYMRNFLNENSGAMRTLAGVFSCFRVVSPVNEIVSTVRMVASTLKISMKSMAKDFIYTCLLTHLDEMKSVFVDSFLLIKVPRILATIKQELFWSNEDMERILHEVLTEGKHILDLFDQETTLLVFLVTLSEAGVISKQFSEHVTNARGHHVHKDHRKHLTWKALEARNVIIKTWNNDAFLSILSKMVGSGGIAFDSVCATFCSDGNVVEFSNKIARLNFTAEKPNQTLDSETRANCFDLTFSLLYRMLQSFTSLKFEEIVNGCSPDNLDQGIFCRWANESVRRLGLPIKHKPVTADDKERNRENFALLRDRGLFWDPITVDYAEVINSMPAICEVIIDQFNENRTHAEYEFKQIIVRSFSTASFLVICIVQWLDSQPDSEVKTMMVRALRCCMDELNPMENNPLPLFIRQSCHLVVDEMLSNEPVVDTLAYTVIVMSERKLPPIRTYQIPERQSLKCGWFHSQKQSWVSPPVLKMLDHCNRAGRQKYWIEVFMHNMLKNKTVDELLAAGEMILASALMDPARSLVALCQCLIDYLIPEVEDEHKVRYEPPHALPLARLVVNVLVLSEWVIAEGKRRAQDNDLISGESERKRRREDFVPTPYPESERAVIEELEQTVQFGIHKLAKKVAEGLLVPVISFISHFLVQLASQSPPENAPHREAWRSLVKKIPRDMLSNLAVLEPNSVSLSLFDVFCDVNDPKSRQERLQFVCHMRLHGAV
ncbi:unnamed protein product, partial [Mesorhabditis belari]|uniref:Mediator of RNA polymerase II transcription subunit 24 n=1 Tax=Mesorhabditis belari TaxID=2138241 RepID=A0AAF3FDA7_9BILA